MPTDINQLAPRSGSGFVGMILPTLIVLSVVVVLVPLPAALLDLLLAANITAAVVILLTTLFVARPLDFSVFPSLLLLATLVRLVLNVASTRLILTRAASHGTAAGGEVIQAFARFVAQDQLAVGLVLFAILIVIQFVVVTKGATRLSEVAARFALDGLPGRQLAIDADLAAGHISPEEARAQRHDLMAQADFHAAMDGASKFVRGDAIAGILIVFINLIGGMVIGIVQYKMAPARAAEVFALLTIGDGLVTQVSGFLIAIAAALLATRSARNSNFSRETVAQTIREPAALYLTAATTLVLAFTGLPMAPLLVLSAGCLIAGERLRHQQRRYSEEVARQQAIAKAKPAEQSAPRLEDQLQVEPIELELGLQLVKLASQGNLLDRIAGLRERIARDIGLILPKIKVRDSLRLEDRSYRFKLRGAPLVSGRLPTDGWLAVDTGSVGTSPPGGDVSGVEALDPGSGFPAKWIEADQAARATALGYQLVEPANVLMAHLNEIVRSHADELLTRNQVHQLLDNLRQTSPRVVEELVPNVLRPTLIHRVLTNLLRERVPIRDLETILTTLGDSIDRTQDAAVLTESVRHALGRTICQLHRDATGTLSAITLDPALEDVLMNGFEFSERGPVIKLTPQITDGLSREVARQLKKFMRAGHSPVIVCGPRVRPAARHILAAVLPKLAVLSLNEIPRDTAIRTLSQVPLNAIKIPTASVAMATPQQTSATKSRSMEVPAYAR